jgi:hypothetical protein
MTESECAERTDTTTRRCRRRRKQQYLKWDRVAQAFEHFVDSLDALGVGTALVDHSLRRQCIDLQHSGEELDGGWFISTP